MTSTLLRLSIAGTGARLLRLLDGLGHYFGIRLEPVRDLHPLAAAHLPDLHEAAALVVGGRDIEGRHEAPEGEALDLLEAPLHVFARDLTVWMRLQGVPDGLHVERADQDAAVVVHGRRHLLRGVLALLPVHLADLADDREVLSHAGELQAVIALGEGVATGRLDVGLGGAPDERDDLSERVADPLELLDRHRR